MQSTLHFLLNFRYLLCSSCVACNRHTDHFPLSFTTVNIMFMTGSQQWPLHGSGLVVTDMVVICLCGCSIAVTATAKSHHVTNTHLPVRFLLLAVKIVQQPTKTVGSNVPNVQPLLRLPMSVMNHWLNPTLWSLTVFVIPPLLLSHCITWASCVQHSAFGINVLWR